MAYKKILLVEDDREISKLVEDHLSREGFQVITAFDGEEAERRLSGEQLDLILLDLMLPKISGMDLLDKIRDKSHIPVIILSAKNSDFDKALGLALGSDDYLAKPFSMLELTARVKAIIRRATEYHAPQEVKKLEPVLRHQNLTLDPGAFSVHKDGTPIKLTSKEFHILKLFMTNPKRVFSKEQIYNLVWDEDYYGDENVINVQIRRLREKIEQDPSQPQYITTIWGIGYKLGE